MYIYRLLCWGLVLLLMAGCAASAPQARSEVESLRREGFAVRHFDTPTFVLYGLLRPARAGSDGLLHVYVEGDGQAWRTRTRPSANPTPRNGITLRLAAGDPNPNVVLYLARPCQFVQGAAARMCSPKYWTSARFAPEVITAVDTAITQAKEAAGASGVVLVGYSGGGGVAALVASRRNDVRFLGSVAGNMDHVAWTNAHRVSPLHASLNPRDVAPKLRGIPQRHMSSTADSVVPPSVSVGYCQALGDAAACVQVPSVQHGGNWESVWNYTYR